MNEPMAGVAKHLKGFPWRYGVGRAGSTAVKRSLFNSVVGRNMLIMACHNHVMPTRKVSLGVVVATGSGAVITIPPTSSN